jgi:hypothetical protein
VPFTAVGSELLFEVFSQRYERPFLLNRLVHFYAAIWHNLSPPLTPLDLDAVTFRHAHGDDVGMRLLAQYRDAMSAVAQRTESGDVVGVQMRVDGLDQPEIELAHELQIAVDLLQHRIDDQRLAASPATTRSSCWAMRSLAAAISLNVSAILPMRPTRSPAIRTEKSSGLLTRSVSADPGGRTDGRHGLNTRLQEWSRLPEPYPPQAGYWCSCFARRPNVRLIWCGNDQIMEIGLRPWMPQQPTELCSCATESHPLDSNIPM